MLTEANIRELAKAGESEALEFKRTTGLRKEAAQTLCAMLNGRGGRVLFGVDKPDKVLGQQVSDKTTEEIAQELADIEPPVTPTVESVTVREGLAVVAVTVSRGQNRPYTYKNQAYKRVGNTTRKMTRDEYNQMLFERLHGEQRWENQTAAGWVIDDLNVTEVTRTLEEGIRRGRMEDPGTRNPEDVLRGLGLLKDGTMLRAAAVLFGRAEKLEAEFPQCLLRVARFKGTDRTEFTDNRQFHGNAFELLVHADRFLRQHLPVAGRIVPDVFERKDDPLYPPTALREAMANAICHRDYSIGGGSIAIGIYDDRLEITSSGTLHFGLTVESLVRPHESLPWNPLIARTFYRRGLIESWGRGTVKMMELTQRAGLPRPEFEEAGGGVTVRFRAGRPVPTEHGGHKLTKRQQKLLELLGKQKRMALRDLQEALGEKAEWLAVKKDMARLRELGLVEAHGHGRGANWGLVGAGDGQEGKAANSGAN